MKAYRTHTESPVQPTPSSSTGKKWCSYSQASVLSTYVTRDVCLYLVLLVLSPVPSTRLRHYEAGGPKTHFTTAAVDKRFYEVRFLVEGKPVVHAVAGVGKAHDNDNTHSCGNTVARGRKGLGEVLHPLRSSAHVDVGRQGSRGLV